MVSIIHLDTLLGIMVIMLLDHYTIRPLLDHYMMNRTTYFLILRSGAFKIGKEKVNIWRQWNF